MGGGEVKRCRLNQFVSSGLIVRYKNLIALSGAGPLHPSLAQKGRARAAEYQIEEGRTDEGHAASLV